MESKKIIFCDKNSDIGNKYQCVCAAASLFKTQESLINNYRLQFKDFMNFIEGLNYQNYTTIDKTREITEKLVESNKKLEENYDSNEYELGIYIIKHNSYFLVRLHCGHIY